jgi:hypothetical protein
LCGGRGVEQVLEDILSEVQIKALVIETKVFEIFAAGAVNAATEIAFIRIEESVNRSVRVVRIAAADGSPCVLLSSAREVLNRSAV